MASWILSLTGLWLFLLFLLDSSICSPESWILLALHSWKLGNWTFPFLIFGDSWFAVVVSLVFQRHIVEELMRIIEVVNNNWCLVSRKGDMWIWRHAPGSWTDSMCIWAEFDAQVRIFFDGSWTVEESRASWACEHQSMWKEEWWSWVQLYVGNYIYRLVRPQYSLAGCAAGAGRNVASLSPGSWIFAVETIPWGFTDFNQFQVKPRTQFLIWELYNYRGKLSMTLFGFVCDDCLLVHGLTFL